jgi:hypothetical protein
MQKGANLKIPAKNNEKLGINEDITKKLIATEN